MNTQQTHQEVSRILYRYERQMMFQGRNHRCEHCNKRYKYEKSLQYHQSVCSKVCECGKCLSDFNNVYADFIAHKLICETSQKNTIFDQLVHISRIETSDTEYVKNRCQLSNQSRVDELYQIIQQQQRQIEQLQSECEILKNMTNKQ